MSTPFFSARDAAVDAAKAAAHLIRQHAGRARDLAVRQKAVHDLVTEIDEAAQGIIIEHLQAAFPAYEVLAEEGTDEAAMQPIAEGFRWIIDPIDGTTNFMHGVPPYAISIALQHKAEIVVAVVYEISRNELFTAVRGHGAYVNGEAIRVSQAATLQDSLLTTGFPYRSFGHIDLYLDVLRHLFKEARGVRRPGVASVDLAYVACGRFDGFFETGLRPWDVAAGSLLVEEAGGRVSDYSDGERPYFDQQVLATNGPMHSAMLEVLEGMRDRRD